jgi:predicted outer membrane protein
MRRAALLVAGALLAAAACADNGDYEEQSGDAEDVAPAAELPRSAGDRGTLTDETVARVLDVVNQGEIDEAGLAREKTQNEEVRRFAEMMIVDHSQLASQNRMLQRTVSTMRARRQL